MAVGHNRRTLCNAVGAVSRREPWWAAGWRVLRASPFQIELSGDRHDWRLFSRSRGNTLLARELSCDLRAIRYEFSGDDSRDVLCVFGGPRRGAVDAHTRMTRGESRFLTGREPPQLERRLEEVSRWMAAGGPGEL